MNLRPWIIIPFLAATLLRAQDALPQRTPGDPVDFPPKLMLDGSYAAAPNSSPKQSPQDRVRECEAALLQVEQRAVEGEQLYKEGILAKVETEARVLRIVQARRDLADARLALAESHADEVKKSFDAHQAAQADVDSANAAAKISQASDAVATADWDAAQLNAAVVDLQRKRKLYSEGVGSRRDLQAAEDKVALLSGTAGR